LSAEIALLGLTVGDCAGVGPQLIIQSWGEIREAGPLCVYGSAVVLRAAADALVRVGVMEVPPTIVTVATAFDARAVPADTIPVVDCIDESELGALDPYPWGEPVAVFGRLQHAALCAAIDDALSGTITAIVTAPWHKKRLADAGLPPTGHTEVLAERSGAGDVIMLLAGPVLRVALATTHMPLRDVADAIHTEQLVSLGTRLAASIATDFAIERPRIAFCGLNPHAGEEGVLGSEDAAIIAPAVAALQAAGIDAFGPVAADTLFPMVAHGRLPADVVVAMYHDQGLGPLKTWHFGESANITLGMPFVRTSVDHGTAYDVAGRGAVRRESFVYAAAVARQILMRRAAAASGG
jgi:4-hydroxythreonine-4-phosphate dehydrogenase